MNAPPTPDRDKQKKDLALAARGLAARGLACRRGRRLLLRGLNLGLPPGSMTWLLGRNGSGKTSLLRILAGLSTPAEGQVTWNGKPVRQAPAEMLYIAHARPRAAKPSAAKARSFLCCSRSGVGWAFMQEGCFRRR